MKMILIALILAILPVLSYAQGNGQPETKSNAKVKPLPTTPQGGLQKATPLNATPAVTPARELSQAEKDMVESRAQLKKNHLKEQQIYMKYLGVSSPNDMEYAARKEKLAHENPEAFQNMKKELQEMRTSGKRSISRAQYNALPADKRASIDANSDKFEIID